MKSRYSHYLCSSTFSTGVYSAVLLFHHFIPSFYPVLRSPLPFAILIFNINQVLPATEILIIIFSPLIRFQVNQDVRVYFRYYYQSFTRQRILFLFPLSFYNLLLGVYRSFNSVFLDYLAKSQFNSRF